MDHCTKLKQQDREKKTGAEVENEEGDEYLKPKCIITNYEKNTAIFIKISQL